MIFYQVLRQGRRHGNVVTLYEGDNRERAAREYDKTEMKLRNGWVALVADGQAERSATGYWLRTRW